MRKLLLAITVTTLVVLFGCAAPRAGPTAGELRANAGGVAPREDGETRAPTADEEAPAAVAIYAPRRSAAAPAPAPAPALAVVRPRRAF